MRARVLLSAGVVLIVAGGCASKPAGPAPAPSPRTATAPAAAPSAAAAPARTAAPRAPRGPANRITEEEIAASAGNVQNALDIVQRLRPSMLRTRAGGAASGGGTQEYQVRVYFDTTPLRGVDGLRDIQSTQVREIRYLSPSDATTLFGTGNEGGAIQVISKR